MEGEKFVMSWSLLFLAAFLITDCKRMIKIKCDQIPKAVKEGEAVTLRCTFLNTIDKKTCFPKDLQFVKMNLENFSTPHIILADFNKLLVDDYRLKVSLDKSSVTWVYNVTIECVTRRNVSDAIAFAALWDCPGTSISYQQPCQANVLNIQFAPTDALPVCPSQPVRQPTKTAPSTPLLPDDLKFDRRSSGFFKKLRKNSANLKDLCTFK